MPLNLQPALFQNCSGSLLPLVSLRYAELRQRNHVQKHVQSYVWQENLTKCLLTCAMPIWRDVSSETESDSVEDWNIFRFPLSSGGNCSHMSLLEFHTDWGVLVSVHTQSTGPCLVPGPARLSQRGGRLSRAFRTGAAAMQHANR